MVFTERLQDLPPPGGFGTVNYKRKPAPYFMRLRTAIALNAGVSVIFWIMYGYNCKVVKFEDMEMRSAAFVTYPIFLAERDRAYLRALRRHRDLETELMKNVKNWQVGKYWDEPLLKNVDEDTWLDPKLQEYYIHAPKKQYMARAEARYWR